jgi:hypothetical protein
MKQMYLHRSSCGQEPPIKRSYDKKFKPTAAYRATLPDMMEVAYEGIQGAHVPIQQVGIHNFKLPLKYRTKAGKTLTLETSVTGTVSLEAELKGINMSRIMRTFYEHKDSVTTGEWMGKILKGYLRKVETKDARLKIAFSYPMLRTSLRTGLEGWQFYNVAFEGVVNRDGRYRRFIHFDFVYSSACPCSAELTEHARAKRGAYGVPFAAQQGARDHRGGRGEEDLDRGRARALPARAADRDAGHGEARGRAGLRRAQRRLPQVRRGRRAAALQGIRRRQAHRGLPHRVLAPRVAPLARRRERHLQGREGRLHGRLHGLRRAALLNFWPTEHTEYTEELIRFISVYSVCSVGNPSDE